MIAKKKKNIVPKGGDTEIGSFGWVAGFGCLFNIYPWITFVDDNISLYSTLPTMAYGHTD